MGLFQHLLALAALALVLGTALPLAAGLFETARLQATLASAKAVAGAARGFRAAEGAWPEGPGTLRGRWLPDAQPRSAWGTPIGLSAVGPRLAVSAPVPLGPAGGTSAFVATEGATLQLGAPPPGDQARLEVERQRLQCHPNGVIEPCD